MQSSYPMGAMRARVLLRGPPSFPLEFLDKAIQFFTFMYALIALSPNLHYYSAFCLSVGTETGQINQPLILERI